MESFEHCHGCVVSPEKVGLPLSLIVEDSTHNRPLRLSVTTEMLGGTALKVSKQKQKWCSWQFCGSPVMYTIEAICVVHKFIITDLTQK